MSCRKLDRCECADHVDQILGWLNAPSRGSWGTWADCDAIGQALGKRIVFTEFIGYMEITSLKETLDPRSFTLATFAICGFANFASIAIQIGGIGSLAPSAERICELGPTRNGQAFCGLHECLHRGLISTAPARRHTAPCCVLLFVLRWV